MVSPTGILLLTFGSAVTADQVPAYLESVYRGREPDPELTAEFERRFRRIGRSPLLEITAAQAAGLERLLAERHGAGALHVVVGMQHSAPWIAEAVDALVEAGITRILGIVLAPQYSPLVLSGYEREIGRARERHPALDIRVAGAWHTVPGWIGCLSDRVAEALAEAPAGPPGAARLIFTAHSLPRSVIDRDPGYVEQLHQTVAAVVDRLHLPEGSWRFGWQSAGHSPAEWLKPDLLDILPELAASGAREVIVAPVQFVADHLETLYDIDVAAGDQAAEHGIRMRRIAMPNASPAMIRGLAEVVERELTGSAAGA